MRNSRSTHRRRPARVLNQGYGDHGASVKKNSMVGWTSKLGSVLDDVEYNIPKLRERSRDLYMGAPLATGALKTIRTSVIGTGLKLNLQIDYDYLGWTVEEADTWETQVEREFSLWADSVHCDAQRMNNFYELQQLVCLSQLSSGDCFVLLPIIPRLNMPYDLRIQVIEADRVCSPFENIHDNKIVNGVEINKIGEVVAYHFAQEHPGSLSLSKSEHKRIEKFGKETGRTNVIHLMESERPEQRRGIPILAPVIESLKQLARYSEAELMAAVVSGMYTVFIKTENPHEMQLGQAIADEEQVDLDNEGTYELGAGAIVGLGENESIETSNPGRPNAGFDGFVTSICRQIGAAIEVPYEILMKHFTSSYSASRAALLEAWKMYRMRRSWIASSFCQPIFEEWLAEGVAKGRIHAPGFFTDPLARKAYTTCEWNGPSQGQLDPLKEVNAAEKRVNNGFSTRSRETVELTGGEFYKNHQNRIVEEKLRREGGLSEDGEKQNFSHVEPPADDEEQQKGTAEE